jgi:hypothetical protein
MSVETLEKLNVILCTRLSQTQLRLRLPSRIYNKDQFSKYAERQANRQIYMVKGTNNFVWLIFAPLCERADKRKLI